MKKAVRSFARFTRGCVLTFYLCGILLAGCCEDVAPSQLSGDQGRMMAVVHVGGDGPFNYSVIQDAIDNASLGDTIFVHVGTYLETIKIDKSIMLLGEERATTILDGNFSGHVIEILAPGVTIENVTVRNSGQVHGGIMIGSHGTIASCTLVGNRDGIWLATMGTGITVTNCSCTGNMIGLYGDNIHENTIISCDIRDNDDGILLDNLSSNNTISQCSITGNKNGIFLWALSNHNVITECTFSHNVRGVRLWDAKHNVFYLNEFQGNTNHTDSIISDNIWNSLVPLNYTHGGILYRNYQGNYWDDYRGVDANGDGIGDSWHRVDAADFDDYDMYPLYRTSGDGDRIPGFGFGNYLCALLVTITLVTLFLREKRMDP